MGGSIWLTHPETQPSSRVIRRHTVIEPERWAAEAYATLHILAHAIAKAQSADSAMIRDALAQTMNLPTILGNFSFDPDGEAVYDPAVFIVKDGQLQVFE